MNMKPIKDITKIDPQAPWPFDLIAPMSEEELQAELFAETEEAPL